MGAKWTYDWKNDKMREIGEAQKLDGQFCISRNRIYLPLTWLFKLLFKWIKK